MTMADQDLGPAPDASTARGATPPPGAPLRVTRSWLGGLWVALASGAVVLLLLLIFILENGHEVDIAFFGAHGQLPLGVALLFAAIFGTLLVVIPGTGRILQLRLAARRRRRIPQPRPEGPPPPD